MKIATGVVVAALLVVAAGGAQAGAPVRFRSNAIWVHSCREGATCTGSAAADVSGNQSAASTVSRPAAVLGEGEKSDASASGSISHRLREPVTAVDVTFRWRIDSASASATTSSAEGATIARVFLRGRLTDGCPACVVTYDVDSHGAFAADAYATRSQQETSEATPGTIAEHRFTVTGPGGGAVPKGSLRLEGTTIAFTAVWQACGPNYPDATSGCLPEVVGHAGHAEAQADTQLLAIDVVERP